jgi:4-amino-4-deoxy-L-arabinose transferase-like glycosyltransferase
MTDLVLMFFSTLALYFFAISVKKSDKITLLYLAAFTSIGFAFLSKGPAGFIVLINYVLYLTIVRPNNWKMLLIKIINPYNILLLFSICLPWYIIVYYSNASVMLTHIRNESTQFTYLPFTQIPHHILFYFSILVIFLIPFSSIAVWQYVKRKISIPKELWLPLMMGITYLLFFTIFVTAGKDRYLLPAFPSIIIVISWILYNTGPVRKLCITAVVLSLFTLSILVIYPVFTGEALRSCVYKWKQLKSHSLAIYNLRIIPKGWALVMAGGKVNVDSYNADYVITDQIGRDTISHYSIIHQQFEREELRFVNNRPVIKGRMYYLLKRKEKQ